MERSFENEIAQLKRGEGERFHGEGILAITKGLLQSGVAYVGGYQGAPVSHLIDVLVQASDVMDELGVHVEACSNEASAAALLAASIHYPVRGAVTWKSVVGTNVASDALSNLASAGVVGGALIVVGEDYGEGASVIQERSLAFALKSSLCLLDPRPELAQMVHMVEAGFALSEASNMPAMLQLRIRACHVRGSFTARSNRAPEHSVLAPFAAAAPFDYARLSHPPATFRQEKLKFADRIPRARAFIREHRLNELMGGDERRLGLILQGGLYNSVVRALDELGLCDANGQSRLPLLVLNVTCPLVPEEISAFVQSVGAVAVIEEGQPEFLEQEIATLLRRAAIDTPLSGKDVFPMAGEYTVEVLIDGLLRLAARWLPEHDASAARAWQRALGERRALAAQLLGDVPPRPPGFCIGCPERPVFAALKLVQEEIGPLHIAADIGCHAFATFEPFSSGHTILGYGMSLASAAGVAPLMRQRTLAIMGDGGFWHNGLLSGVQSALFNQDDMVLLILKNGYTSATGTQDILSSPQGDEAPLAENRAIERTLEGMGLSWLDTVHTYDVEAMMKALKEAFTTDFAGLKVIVGEGECQLERQRRIRPARAAALARGERVERVKYGVDESVCSGDHSCIRLSGCPTLTLKDSADPLKVDPVVTIQEGCVGCGLCGSNAHAATLCPSFYEVTLVRHPRTTEKLAAWARRWWTGIAA